MPNRLAGEAVRALGAPRCDGADSASADGDRAVTSIDGCLDPWDVVPGLRLNDLLKTHTDSPNSPLSTAIFRVGDEQGVL